jgi:hypothetical protein
LSPRVTRSAKDGATPSSSRRRPALPGRGRKSGAVDPAAPRPEARAADAGLSARETHEGTVVADGKTWADLTREPAKPAAHTAMPKLMGQPAYARPPRQVAVAVDRPIDPDDLPLEAFRSEEDRALAEHLARSGTHRTNGQNGTLRPSSVGGLRGIAGRLFGPRN